MQKLLECHFGYCQYMTLRSLRNSFCITQVQFCQNGHTEGTFLDVAKCWKSVPVAILASPEGCWAVAVPQLPTLLPCEAAWWHGTELMHGQPDLIGMIFDLYLWKPTEVFAKFTARHVFSPL